MSVSVRARVGEGKGPWSGAAHFSALQCAAKSYCSTGSSDDPLFGMCYEWIVSDYYSGQVPPFAFTKQAKQEVWDWMLGCPMWNLKGSRQKPSRWFQWNVLCEDMGRYFGSLFLLILRMWIEAGWWKNASQVPGMSSVAEVEPVPSDEVEADPTASAEPASSSATPASASAAEKALKHQREQSKCTLHLVGNLLANRVHVALMKMIYVVGRPSHAAHQRQVVECKTQRGTMEWWFSQIGGLWCGIATAIAGVMCNDAACAEVGMPGISNPITGAGADYREFMKIARTFFAFTVALMRAEINEGRMFSEFPPYRMFALAGRHGQLVQALVSSTPW